MMPPARKPSHLSGHQGGRDLPAPIGRRHGDIDTTAPSGILASTRKDWTSFWSSEKAQYVKPEHLPALRRMFDLYDQRERSKRAIRKNPIVKGSMGQPVEHPLRRSMESAEKEIRQLEDRFGLTPGAEARLKTAFADGGETLEDMKAAYVDDRDEPDPRLALVQLPGRNGGRADTGVTG